MFPISRLAWIVVGLLLLGLAPALAQEKPPEKPWTGKLDNGQVITKADLDQILQDHKLWVESNGIKGNMAHLVWAHLEGAYLIRAQLYMANLTGAYLTGADLTRANLMGAQLSRADLTGAHLTEADLSGAHLTGANLTGANLSRARLDAANMYEAKLNRAHLYGAYLTEADLSGADLRGADLTEAFLFRAHLYMANLTEADLTRAYLKGAYLSGALFEPKPGTLPEGTKLLYLRGLDSLKFDGTGSNGLMDLREIFKKAGMREDERQVTFALNHNRRVNAWAKNREKDLVTREIARLGNYFQQVLFEWTCDWGMTPERPLIIMFAALFGFTLPYLLALRSRNPKTGIWGILPQDRVLDREMQDRPIKLTFRLPSPAFPENRYRFRGILYRGWRGLRLAFYFSLLSAFNIGWHELNVGNWITRIQKREYKLRATGWVRMISGFPALLSVYLLALSVLTYFGRPFD